MVTDHLQAHWSHFRWMVVVSRPRPKDSVPLADQPVDDCFEEDHSEKEEIPHPLAE